MRKSLHVVEILEKIANAGIVYFTVVCFVAKPLKRYEAKGDLFMIQTLLHFKCKLLCYHQMQTRYWSLSQHGQLQPHSKSKAWQLNTQL